MTAPRHQQGSGRCRCSTRPSSRARPRAVVAALPVRARPLRPRRCSSAAEAQQERGRRADRRRLGRAGRSTGWPSSTAGPAPGRGRAARPRRPAVAVVIDEAVELAKAYSTDDSGRFVNGVLSTIAAELAAW